MIIKKKKILIVFLLSIFLVSLVSASSTQFSKIFLNPFYSESMEANITKNFTLSVLTPQRISDVTSAIIYFDIWLNPSINFTLLVNGQECINRNYYISSNYASAGKNSISFDCSNIIEDNGNYDVLLTSNKDTGAVVGWLDLYYFDDPLGSMVVHGTEYTYGQTAKPFLQLLNSSGGVINNGLCYLDIYSPSMSILQEDALMTNFNHDGLYYYDYAVPSVEGVYPVLAKCYYDANQIFNYPSSYQITRGSYDSGSINDVILNDGTFIRFKEAPVNPVRNISINITFSNSTYCNNISEDLLNSITIRTVAKFDSVNADNVTIAIWNYTSSSWLNLSNIIIEGNVFRDVSNTILGNNISKLGFINSSGGGIILKYEDKNIVDGATSNLDMDYIALSCDGFFIKVYQELKGSSELHVSAPINVTVVAQEIWSYSNRSLTYYMDTTNYSKISDYVWNATNRNLTYAPDLTNYLLIQTLVWNATNRNLTFTDDVVNYTKLANYVWNYSERNLTYYQINNLTANDVWNFANRNLTFYEDKTNYSLISEGVWSYANRNLTYYEVNNLSAIDIWNYANRTLTQNISEEVWMYYNKTLTYYPVNNLSANEIWSYVNRSLTQDVAFEIWSYANRTTTNNISLEVWSYYNRSLTYYPEVDLSGIPENVWNYTNRNLTYYPSINETSIASAIWSWTGGIAINILSSISTNVWAYTTRTLTFTEDVTNYTRISEGVWNYSDRNLTYYVINNISPEEIWNYTSRNLTFYPDPINYSQVAEFVWMYQDRNLTFYQTNNITADEIWSYYNRSLTDDIPMQVWSYANRNLTSDIPFEVWSYYNRSLTYYTINLTELIEMINNYNFTDPNFLGNQGNQFQFQGLNATLIVYT